MPNKWKDIPIVSGLLVGINIIVYFISLIPGNMLWSKGLLGVEEVLVRREYGRLIYSMFLHGDLEHLFNNMIIALFLGAMLEKEIGHVLYFMVYMLSGLGGGALSLFVRYIQADPSMSLGASGAVFGLDGLLLAMVLVAGKQLPHISLQRVMVMVVLSLYNGMRSTGIDNVAHAGGLITGFILGIIISLILYRKDRRPIREY